MAEDAKSTGGGEASSADSLRSWKEIAGFIDRDERTAMRWAKEQGMPVRRVPGGKRGRIFASRAEILTWLSDLPLTNAPVKAPSPERKRLLRIYLVAALPVCIVLVMGLLRVFQSHTTNVPIGVSFSGDSILAVDANDRVLWTYYFPGRLDPVGMGIPDLSHLAQMARILDLEGDGNRIVVAVVPVRAGLNPQDGFTTELDCFSSSGHLLWSYLPHETISFGENTLDDRWLLSDFIVSRRANRFVIYAAFIHGLWGNSFVAEIDPAGGRGVMRFVNTGTSHSLTEFTTPQTTYLLVGGFNNEFEGGSLALLDERKQFAASPQTQGTNYKCISCPPGEPDYYFVFPRSEVSGLRGIHDNFVSEILVDGEKLEVHKREVEPSTQTFYLLRPNLLAELIPLRFDSTYDALHQELESRGELHHSLSECPERLHPKPVLAWTPVNGWTKLTVKSTQ